MTDPLKDTISDAELESWRSEAILDHVDYGSYQRVHIHAAHVWRLVDELKAERKRTEIWKIALVRIAEAVWNVERRPIEVIRILKDYAKAALAEAEEAKS